LYFQYCQKLASPRALSLDEMRRCPSAQVIVEHACEWLSGIAGKPFFLWLHLMDPHSPYHPPRQALELMGDHGVTDSRARYLNSFWSRSDIGVAAYSAIAKRSSDSMKREFAGPTNKSVPW